MSLSNKFIRPCRTSEQICRRSLARTRSQRPQKRHFQGRSPAAEAEVQAAQAYCSNLLQKYDSPAYLLHTFIPQHARPMYFALRALNVSLSLIPDTTSSHTIGLMRLQYWRDAVTKTLAGRPPKEPIAILLAAAIEDLHTRTGGAARISKGWLTRLINAREQTLTNDPYPTLAALEAYAENTYSTLSYLTLSALPMTSVTADHLASHVGKAVGIAAVLRGLPLVAFPQQQQQQQQQNPGAGVGQYNNKQGAVMLPLDVMAQAGLREEDVFRQGAEAPGLRDAVFTVATRANDHLITAQQMLSNLRAGQDVGHEFEHEGEEGHTYEPSPDQNQQQRAETPLEEVNRAFGVLMPAIPTRLWLARLESFDFDIFRPELLRSDWTLPWKAYWAFKRKAL
ncbi:hypothetical protein ASPACDRAFT_1898864 [Aspergillus aculeatus ATCC 16872]|uniref:Squalene/phytoene synthase n=1 Tax=Aspergillus aculeatus (strain ATCC 16872 / CBS 172.66 / WB 5094) TaxID=690307 RepID=A0A1L9WZY1_ASPA1|nr:uncharacterized protein ASPACDRAFT_1898864 [Aspergillus aculeatus ATCC 16872]OJK01694.1 hypothetical protein ASPACDRAFT_1898864 [Aspergillus aculeatus ATCC 16872]